jgi:carbamoyl-phosphate synthase large subunit
MPRRTDLGSILVIGSGPIVIGQGCEFDYSGSQATRVLRREGYRVILVNSNPATIMTDPDFADATYVEPLTPEVVAAIIERERPDALIPTLGGQTALNLTARLADGGVLDKYDVELIGASIEAIATAEDRGRFKAAMESAGIATARGAYIQSIPAAQDFAAENGFPVMIRPSYILGGGGTGLAYGRDELDSLVTAGLAASPVGEVLVEESLLGWKEYELEVMRDRADNAVIVCGIENLDPMGVHTGDSITVAPIQTLSDREYQEMRNEAIACLRAIGVETGGSNVQFAVDPANGRRIIIEMNPRVSRSSALASKATGFPIAKIAALLAVGYTLDEITNDITGATPASFEPALDYVVVKIPRFDFAKFPLTRPELGTSMRSVGEAMAIGRTFPEALQKAIRSLETGRAGLNADPGEAAYGTMSLTELIEAVSLPTPDRIFQLAEALRRGADLEELAAATAIDPWFLDQILALVEARRELEVSGLNPELVLNAKRLGFSDRQIAHLTGTNADEVLAARRRWRISAAFKTVDTCAAEFAAETPYFYSSYEEENETPPPSDRTVIVLGSGPNRIGQGIEFDYCCVHASLALQDAGYQSVMINCNPETVSTDYDTSTRLYFEPLTVEDVMEVVAKEQPRAVIVQLGGQTPLNLASALEEAGVPIAGTSPAAIAMAEDREQFSALCSRLGIPQPPHGTARSAAEAEEVVDRIGLPVLVRPSYVLGGRDMRVLYGIEELAGYVAGLTASGVVLAEAPLLIDRFLESAVEADVDAIYDGDELIVGGIMEHVEEAGVHSGDSACIVPPPTISKAAQEKILRYTADLADGLDVRGLINLQFAVRGDEVFVLEANPRGSRTVPFISKATGVPLAGIATRVMLGETLADLRRQGLRVDPVPREYVAVKEAVMPWDRFPGEDVVLGPEMRATGEVMGIAPDPARAYGKAQVASGSRLPAGGTAFLSFADRDKEAGAALADVVRRAGFRLLATAGTSAYLGERGIPAVPVDKVGDGPWDPVRLIEEGKVDLVINTPRGRRAHTDGRLIRLASTRRDIPCITTMSGGQAMVDSLQYGQEGIVDVRSLQEYHA